MNERIEPRARLHLSDYDDLLAEVDRLAASGYERAGRWSLGMVCEHLARTLRMPFEPTMRPLPSPVRWALRRTVLPRLLRRGIPRGMPAPKKLCPPETTDDTAGIARLRDAVDLVRRQTAPTVPHPLFGRLPRERNDRLQLVHAGHHLAYLVPRG